MKRPALLDKIRVDQSGCWLYSGQVRADGYVTAKRDGRTDYAHRISFLFHNGEIPAGYEIDHMCSVRHCLNPAHLRAVPPRVNVLAGTSPTAINAARTECTHGHPFDADNTIVEVYRGSVHRQCRTCRRRRTQEYKRRKAA